MAVVTFEGAVHLLPAGPAGPVCRSSHPEPCTCTPPAPQTSSRGFVVEFSTSIIILTATRFGLPLVRLGLGARAARRLWRSGARGQPGFATAAAPVDDQSACAPRWRLPPLHSALHSLPCSRPRTRWWGRSPASACWRANVSLLGWTVVSQGLCIGSGCLLNRTCLLSAPAGGLNRVLLIRFFAGECGARGAGVAALLPCPSVPANKPSAFPHCTAAPSPMHTQAGWPRL